jgi:hypothetical protein
MLKSRFEDRIRKVRAAKADSFLYLDANFTMLIEFPHPVYNISQYQ